MNGSSQSVDVALCFDVEDIFSEPEVGNDDSIRELATILHEERLRGNFLFIGDRALQLRSRGRQDVIDSLAPHEVGLHTRSARHPTSPEYVAGKCWQEAVDLCLQHEREGAEIIGDVFGKPCTALSTHNNFDSPHSQRAAGILGLPYVYCFPAAPPLCTLSWYAGALGLPYPMPDVQRRAYFEFRDTWYHPSPGNKSDTPFQLGMRQLDTHLDLCLDENQPFLTLFLFHPQRLRLVDFIDWHWSPNGVNYPKGLWGHFGSPRRRSSEEVETALGNFRRLAQFLREDQRVNVITMSEVKERYGRQPESITREELIFAAKEISTSSEILIHASFSPAEMLVGMAHAVREAEAKGALPREVPRKDVLGPLNSPIWIPELQACDAARLAKLAGELIGHVESTGHLPATLGAPLERVGANHLYGAFAGYVLEASIGNSPSEIRFRRMPPWPALASQIGIAFMKQAEADTVDPDIDVNTLYRDGKLQTWTLKPATLPGCASTKGNRAQ